MRSSEDYHDLAVEYGIKSPGKSEAKQSQQWRDRVDNVHSQAQRTGKVDAGLVKDASGFSRSPRVAASSLAHTPPPDMGKSRYPTGDHDPRRYDWGNDPNIGKN